MREAWARAEELDARRAWRQLRRAARAPATRGPPGPARAVVDSRAVGPGDLFVGAPRRARATGRVRAAGARGGRLGRDRDAEDAPRPGRRAPRARVLAAARSARRAPGAWRAAGATSSGARRSGSPGRRARRRPRTSWPRCWRPTRRPYASPANFNTEIGLPLDDPGGARRHRGARARDGHARRRPDRRADGDRAARRGRDRQRRARSTSSCSGTMEARGRGQGGADPRHARRGHRRRSGRRAAARAPPARRPRAVTFGDGRRRAPARGRRRARGDRRARASGSSWRSSYTQAYNRLNTLAAVAAALAVGVRPSRARRGPVLGPAGRADRARGRRRRHQRLLQRQPDVDARGA